MFCSATKMTGFHRPSFALRVLPSFRCTRRRGPSRPTRGWPAGPMCGCFRRQIPEQLLAWLPQCSHGYSTALKWLVWRVLRVSVGLMPASCRVCATPSRVRPSCRFESLAQAFFTEEFRACKDHMRHKTTMISPLQIQKAGIGYCTAVQVRWRKRCLRRVRRRNTSCVACLWRTRKLESARVLL